MAASEALEIVCPRCHNELESRDSNETLCCGSCGLRCPVIAGIPDLRISGDPFLTVAEDQEAAQALAARASRLTFPALLASYYDGNVLVPAAQARAIIRGTLAAPVRSRSFLTHAERLRGIAIGPTHRVLDIGAGTGPLTVELAKEGAEVWAVDIGLRWVALARARAADAGVTVTSLCAGINNLQEGLPQYEIE